MDGTTWIAVGSLAVSVASAVIAGRAAHAARRADRRTAAFKRPVFKVDSLRADDRFTWVTVRNIAGEVAHGVRVRLEDDPAGRLFHPSRTPGVHTGIVEQGATSTEVAPVSRDGWPVSAFGLERVVVEFRTADGERHSQVLDLPMMQDVD
ncbi:MAG: hypothetical protein ACO1ON_13095 [Nocardioides sp.]